MLKSPHHRIEYQLELCWWYIKERLEAVCIDCLQQLIEAGSMLRIVLKVLIDHIQCALEDGIKYFWYLVGNVIA